MSDNNGRDQMLDMFIFESNQLIEQLEEIMLDTEKEGELNSENINEIFRIMHTIKGSSAMMTYNNISKLAHSVEDLFYYIRENHPDNIDISEICDLVLAASDFIKQEVSKVDEGKESDGDEKEIEARIKQYLAKISGSEEVKRDAAPAAAAKAEEKKPEPQPEEEAKNSEVPPDDFRYIAKIYFDEGGQMENVRAYTISRNLMEFTHEMYTYPKDLLNTPPEIVLENGFMIFFATNLEEKQLRPIFEEALFLKSYEISRVESYESELQKYNLTSADSTKIKDTDSQKAKTTTTTPAKVPESNSAKNNAGGKDSSVPKNNKMSLISVNVNKLDSLMNLVGEIVISESMVTRNPDLKGLQLDNFNKAARQLRKLTDELQDIVMSIRMIPIAGTFQKMQRIVRDMSRKLNKDVEFVTVGEDTEVDKNIIDHLSDPLMHLIRNAMDHGVESEEERIKKGKAPKARITLTATIPAEI